MNDEKQARIIQARLKLRERFQAKTSASPSLADTQPLGHGPRNRHGMPQVPPDQTVTHKWPVLDLGVRPSINTHLWRLQLDGACQSPGELDWAALQQLPPVEITSDFHCVTGWSKLDMQWHGVSFVDLAALANPSPQATHILCHGYDGYTTNLSLAEALKPDVVIAYGVDGKPLAQEHGGPVRMVTPQLWAWKGAKWICRIEFLTQDRPGFWEQRGYSNTAYPWRNDRYS